MNETQRAALEGYLPSPSQILSHEAACCRRARSWLVTRDGLVSYREQAWQAPTWVRKQFDWGPVHWPIYWCDVPEAATLDCGALASLSLLVLRARGARVAQAQLVLRYPEHALRQWAQMWRRSGESTAWVQSNTCYHEACAVFERGEVAVWDPTETRWMDTPGEIAQFSGVMGVRLHWADHPGTVSWGGRRLANTAWTWFEA